MEAIQSFDFSILDGIRQSLTCPFLDGLSVFLHYFASWGIIWIVLGIVLLFFRKTRATGIILLAALALGFLVGDVALKHIVQRPRPFLVNPGVNLLIPPPSGSSFPSTHSTLAAAAATVLLAKKRSLGIIVAVIAVCLAFSRLYLYVHFPTDVVCGLILGVLCGVAALSVARAAKLEKRLGN